MMPIFKRLITLLIFIVLVVNAFSQTPIINYVVSVDTSDLTGYNIEMHITNAPKSFHLAMATHHEYDDRYWRFVENFSVEPANNNFKREDSALWRITVPGKDAFIKYRIHLPVNSGEVRPVWRPFLSATGGMVGDMHTFMYLVEKINAPSFITFQLPTSWQITTGLEPTKDPKVFYASNAKTLLDCPALIGKFQSWNFFMKSVPHKIVYWSAPNAIAFDTNLLVRNIKKIVEQTLNLFDSIPYKHYTFLLQDGAYGALEHGNSVPIGIPSPTFERDIIWENYEIAHEFFHTWNLMRLRPAEYSELNYGPQEKAGGLWWSEGLSVFYSDLLVRRAKLPVYDSTRTIHLEKLIESYYSNPGYEKISPEKSSLESNAQPGGLGDYNISVHLQGEVVGNMIDLIIRDATNGKYSIDYVMKKMFYKFSAKGFHAKDIEQTIKGICNCDIHSFFEKYIYHPTPMNFNQYLELIGQQVTITWKPATDESGKPSPDWQMNIYRPINDTGFNILIYNPESCWAKAGLHTNDRVVSINDTAVMGTQTWRNIQRNLQVGDKVVFRVKQKSGIKEITVNVTGYDIPTAHITTLKNITSKQQRIFKNWNDLN